jgi:salicylate hydroxylase
MLSINQLSLKACSQHLGQGANQAFEDVDSLVRLLIEHHPAPDTEPSSVVLSTIFTEFEAKRMERTATLVKDARKEGELRVVEGIEQARARNDIICAQWAEGGAVMRERLLKH